MPLTGNNWPGRVEIEGQPSVAQAERRRVAAAAIGDAGLLRLLLGLPIAEGRDFRDSDANAARRVAIVNQALADRYFPGGSAIGKKLWHRAARQQPPTEIVGVVANGRTDDLTRTPSPNSISRSGRRARSRRIWWSARRPIRGR